jgi:hypothetical protein
MEKSITIYIYNEMPESHGEVHENPNSLGRRHLVSDHGSQYSSEHKESVPILIRKDNIRNSNYFVMVGDDYPGDNPILTQYERIDIIADGKKEQKKGMDYVTHVYIGSLTVLGLFIFYKLLNKTK